MEEGFRNFDHTGDLGLEVWAGSPERLFGLAAEALCAQVAEAPPGAAEFTRRIELEGDEPEDLLIHWLNTVLLAAELDRVVWTHVVVSRLGRRSLSASLAGQRLDPARQVLLREIKAVSHHGLELDLEGRPCRCRLVLDL